MKVLAVEVLLRHGVDNVAVLANPGLVVLDIEDFRVERPLAERVLLLHVYLMDLVIANKMILLQGRGG